MESIVTSRTRFTCFLPVLIFIALRALFHAYPTPLPWTSGVFDGEGLDDILQTIRIAYTGSTDIRHVGRDVLTIPTGRVALSEPSLVRGAFLTSAQSRAPPRS